MRSALRAILPALLLAAASDASGANRTEILDLAIRVADRLAAIRSLDRGWEDGPYLAGSLLVWEEAQKDSPGAAPQLRDRALRVIGGGDAPVTNGDNCGYAQAAMDALRLMPPGPGRDALLAATDGPLELARLSMRYDAAAGPPLSPWWIPGGYGTRYWEDDLYTLVPWLAMRGSHVDGLPGDAAARDLAYEWIESYAFDHRTSLGGEPDAAVPTLFAPRRSGWERGDPRTGRFLLDPARGLFFHDPSVVGEPGFWGRGNGWVALGLGRAQRYLDRPYAGGRFARVLGRRELRRLLSRMAATLAAERNDSGTWNADIVRRELFTKPETSGSGLLTFLLATGVGEGWLERVDYTPIVLKAFRALTAEVDEEGDVHDIQPSGTGPDARVVSSDDPSFNSDFGVGAFLLAAAAVSRLPAEDLARMEDDQEDAPPPRRWMLPGGVDEVVLVNPGSADVEASISRGGGSAAALPVPSGATAVFADPGSADGPLAVAAEGELLVVGRRGSGVEEEEEKEPASLTSPGGREGGPAKRLGARSRGISTSPALELSEALLGSEEAILAGLDGRWELHAVNLGALPSRVSFGVFDATGSALGEVALDVPAKGETARAGALAAFPAAAYARVTNRASGSAVVAFATLDRGGGEARAFASVTASAPESGGEAARRSAALYVPLPPAVAGSSLEVDVVNPYDGESRLTTALLDLDGRAPVDSDECTVAAGAATRIAMQPSAGTACLRVTPTAGSIAVSARIVAARTGVTLPVAAGSEALEEGEKARLVLAGLARAEALAVLVNTSPEPAPVSIEIRARDGAVSGTRRIPLAPDSAVRLPLGPTANLGHAVITLEGAARVLAFAAPALDPASRDDGLFASPRTATYSTKYDFFARTRAPERSTFTSIRCHVRGTAFAGVYVM